MLCLQIFPRLRARLRDARDNEWFRSRGIHPTSPHTRVLRRGRGGGRIRRGVDRGAGPTAEKAGNVVYGAQKLCRVPITRATRQLAMRPPLVHPCADRPQGTGDIIYLKIFGKSCFCYYLRDGRSSPVPPPTAMSSARETTHAQRHPEQSVQ